MQPADGGGEGERAPGPEERAAAERRARLRRRLRPVLLVVGVLLTAINLWICQDRETQKAKVAEREGFLRYMRGDNHDLQAQLKSVLSGLAGLVDETAPTAKGAVDILDQEIVPNLDFIAESGRTMLPEGEPARRLHSAYLRALAATKADAVKLRGIFADTSVPLEEQRQRARKVLVETAKLYQAFDREVLDTARQVNTVIVAPPTTSPGPAEGAPGAEAPKAPAPAAPAAGAPGSAPAPAAPGALGGPVAPAPAAPTPAPAAPTPAPAAPTPAPAAPTPAPAAPTPAPAAPAAPAPR